MAAFSALQTDVFSNLFEQNSDDNERLSLTQVKAHINEAYIWAFEQGCLLNRDHVITAVDEQQLYALPADMFAIEDVYWYTTTKPLTRTTRADLRLKVATAWRATDSGTPTRYFKDGERSIGLYPKSNVAASEYITVYGWVIPYAAGTTVSSISRTTTTMTVTTSAAHGLIAGDIVIISGTSESVFHATHTVVSAATSTTWTATVANSGATTATGGYIRFSGGLLPLVADGDIPAFYAGCHDLLVQRAMVTLSKGILAGSEHAQAVAPYANAKALDYLAKLKSGVYR